MYVFTSNVSKLCKRQRTNDGYLHRIANNEPSLDGLGYIQSHQMFATHTTRFHRRKAVRSELKNNVRPIIISASSGNVSTFQLRFWRHFLIASQIYKWENESESNEHWTNAMYQILYLVLRRMLDQVAWDIIVRMFDVCVCVCGVVVAKEDVCRVLLIIIIIIMVIATKMHLVRVWISLAPVFLVFRSCFVNFHRYQPTFVITCNQRSRTSAASTNYFT